MFSFVILTQAHTTGKSHSHFWKKQHFSYCFRQKGWAWATVQWLNQNLSAPKLPGSMCSSKLQEPAQGNHSTAAFLLLYVSPQVFSWPDNLWLYKMWESGWDTQSETRVWPLPSFSQVNYFCCLNAQCNAGLKEKGGKRDQKDSSVTSTAAEVRAGICPGATAVSIYYVHVCMFLLLLFQVNAIFKCLNCRSICSLIKHWTPNFFSFSLHLKPVLSPAIMLWPLWFPQAQWL